MRLLEIAHHRSKCCGCCVVMIDGQHVDLLFELHSELLMLVILRFHKCHKLLLVILQDKCMRVGYCCLYNYELSTLGNSLLLSYITT